MVWRAHRYRGRLSFGAADGIEPFWRVRTYDVTRARGDWACLSGERAVEQFQDEERDTRYEARTIQMANPGIEILQERRVRGGITAVQPAAIVPQRRGIKEPLQQADRDHAVAFPHIRIRFQRREVVREPLRKIAGARIAIRDAHRVGGEVRCVRGRLGNPVRGIIGRLGREAVENSEASWHSYWHQWVFRVVSRIRKVAGRRTPERPGATALRGWPRQDLFRMRPAERRPRR